MFTGQNSHTRDWFYFENTVKRNMEICDLNSYTHELINILFKQIQFLHIVNELTKVECFVKKVWVCSHVVIGAVRGVFTAPKGLNVTMVFEFLIFIGIEFHSIAPDTEAAFCPTLLFFDNLYVHQSRF